MSKAADAAANDAIYTGSGAEHERGDPFDGWVPIYSEEHDRDYYYHAASGQVSWEAPQQSSNGDDSRPAGKQTILVFLTKISMSARTLL